MAPFTGHPYDFEVWARLGVYLQGLMTPYTDLPYYPGVSFSPQVVTGSISYPPLSAFMFALTYRAYLLVGAPSRFVYYFLLKQPIIISDILTAIVLARIILMNKDASSARLGFLIWIYLPLSVLSSSVWGALDPIALLLTLFAVFYMLRSQETASACFLGLAIFLKTMPVVALPVLVMSIKTGFDKRLRYVLTSLVIPAFGTIVPVFLLNWGINGVYNNLSFQADIPGVGGTHGEMSILGRLVYVLEPTGILSSIVGLFWIPMLLLSYMFISRRKFPPLQGVLVAILAFSIGRVFLSEQWAIYPLALLLGSMSEKSIAHFVGLSVPATVYLVINNTLLLRFLAPTSTGLAGLNIYGNSLLVGTTLVGALMILAGLFFIEALTTIVEKESFLNSILDRASGLLKIHWHERVRTTVQT